MSKTSMRETRQSLTPLGKSWTYSNDTWKGVDTSNTQGLNCEERGINSRRSGATNYKQCSYIMNGAVTMLLVYLFAARIASSDRYG